MKASAPKSRIDQLTRVERLALGQLGRKVRRTRDRQFQLHLLRMREIERIIEARHGKFVPDTDDAVLTYIMAAAITLRSEPDLRNWCARWAPWCLDDYDELVTPYTQRACARKYMQHADAIAKELRVTYAEREALGLNTIGACDVSAAKRKQMAKERKRALDRLRQEQKRRKAGKADRKSQRAESLAALQPWNEDGISRATWYRRQRETAKSRVDNNTIGDFRVSPPVDGVPPTPFVTPCHSAAREARGGGLGDHHPAGVQGREALGSGDSPSEEAA